MIGNPLGSPNTASMTIKDRIIIEDGDVSGIRFSKENLDVAKADKIEKVTIYASQKEPNVAMKY